MKPLNYKTAIAKLIGLLFILLLVYAALVKILDFERFSRQLSQSPLWPAVVGKVMAWVVPTVELTIAIVLLLPQHQLHGLYAGTGLMILFTLYIIYILKFSGYVPCACGGVIERLGWKQHLWFNLGFVVLGIIGIGIRQHIKRK